jgi:hypothetical protein
MRLYSTRDIAQILEKALRDKGFSIDKSRSGAFESSQMAGFVSQTFKIKVESTDGDPL